MYNMYRSQLGSPTTSLLLLIFPAALRRLLLMLLLLLLEAIHLQSKFVLEGLNKTGLLLLVVFGVWVVLGEAGTTRHRLVKFGATLSENLEPENLRGIVIDFRGHDNTGREMLQEHMRETRTEETPIEIDVSAS